MSQAAIELKGIACTFVSDDSGTLSTYTAVKNVDLTVADGEFVSVVGPTDCGKSTLLNMSAGLWSPAPVLSASSVNRLSASIAEPGTCFRPTA